MFLAGPGGKQGPGEGMRGGGMPGAVCAVFVRASDRDDPAPAVQPQL